MTTTSNQKEQTDDALFRKDTPQIVEIVVTAQKRSENAQTVPITITALSGDALRGSA